MFRYVLAAALVLGSAVLGVNRARADYRWFGPYDDQATADAVGDNELRNGGASGYGAGYQSEDPTGGGRGAGYYALVAYPDAPTPGPQTSPGGILGVPFPGGGPDPAGPDSDLPPDDDDGMDP